MTHSLGDGRRVKSGAEITKPRGEVCCRENDEFHIVPAALSLTEQSGEGIPRNIFGVIPKKMKL